MKEIDRPDVSDAMNAQQMIEDAHQERLAAPEIPAKKSARVRTLVKFGMTASQVAEIYGVPVETQAA